MANVRHFGGTLRSGRAFHDRKTGLAQGDAEQARAKQAFTLFCFSSNHMTQLKISNPGLPAQRDTARHLIEQARVVLVYLGIVATFAVVSLIVCIIWLLIW
jgi:hypothetical protein